MVKEESFINRNKNDKQFQSRVLDLGKFLSDLKCSTIFFVYQTRVRFYISAYTRGPLI
jgi:hypothetical protein